MGWRQPLFVPVSIQKELNGPVFYLRANLFLGELFKVMKNKEPLFTQEPTCGPKLRAGLASDFIAETGFGRNET